MTTTSNREYVDPAVVVADAFRITLKNLPPHGQAILRAIATAARNFADGSHYAHCCDPHLVRGCFAACREDLELALCLLSEVERAAATYLVAEPV